ncbi:ribonuclease H-like domain-containing protein [Tanacetum coccineum]|uniref:Ribonuclease H-like domain-containing protein n=1 Tax=Tanacetum coccineum TaxID=301880 RepID=A0ABQ5FQN9_9ASTR
MERGEAVIQKSYLLSTNSLISSLFEENADNGMGISIDSPIPFSSTKKHENALPFHFSTFHSTVPNIPLVNRIPSSMLSGKSPYELVFNVEPNISHLKAFGFLCFSTVLNDPDKFSSRSKKSVFIGYSNDKKGYKLYSLESKKSTSSEPNDDERDIRTERSKGTKNISLEEKDSESEGDGSFYHEFNEMFEAPNVVLDSQSGFNPRRSSRKTSMPKKLSDFKLDTKVKYSIDKQVNYSNLSLENYNFSTSLNKIIEPKTFDEASKYIRWVEAMNLEMDALIGMLQLDINNAFMYGDLVEDVYMSLPDGYFSKGDTRVCKLVKSLYGLKQAPRKWNEKLTIVLLKNEFKQNDIVITGIEVLESGSSLYLTQGKYCLELLTEFGMLACKPCGTHIESKKGVVKTSKAKVTDIDNPLTRIIFMHAPLQSHLKLAFRILRYLKNAPSKGISFNKEIWFLRKVKKQSMLSKSSAEVEYMAMNSVTCEVIWILEVLTELNIDTSLPVPLHCDNISTIQIVANPVFHERTKHFEIELFFLREKVANGVVKTMKIKFADNTTDIFTKGLSVVDHSKFCENLRMYDLYRISLRGNIENNNPNPVMSTKSETQLKTQG